MASGSLYLLTGTETFLRRRRLAQLVEERLPEGLGDFNYVRIDGKETSLVDILSTWEERGFGGDRVIHVDNADKIRMKKDDKVSELFLKRAKTGVPHALMILEAESVDRRKSFYKKLSALAVSEEFKPLRDYQVPGFIAGELSAKGYVIDPDAAEFMAMFTSSELMVISSELEKLILYMGPDQTRITLDSVRGLLMPSRQYTLFDMQDALVDGKKDLAIRAVRAAGRRHLPRRDLAVHQQHDGTGLATGQRRLQSRNQSDFPLFFLYFTVTAAGRTAAGKQAGTGRGGLPQTVHCGTAGLIDPRLLPGTVDQYALSAYALTGVKPLFSCVYFALCL